MNGRRVVAGTRAALAPLGKHLRRARPSAKQTFAGATWVRSTDRGLDHVRLPGSPFGTMADGCTCACSKSASESMGTSLPDETVLIACNLGRGDAGDGNRVGIVAAAGRALGRNGLFFDRFAAMLRTLVGVTTI